MPEPRYGVVGWPVAHSRSPAMHQALGLSYQLLPVPPQRIEQTLRALPGSGFRGVNVTIPHKEAALAVASSASDAAREIGAANTLIYGDEGEIFADNTDAPGLLAAVEGRPARTAVVLGAGGSARAVVWALVQHGTEVAVWNRTTARAQQLTADLGGRVIEREEAEAGLPAADLLVNCAAAELTAPDGGNSVGDTSSQIPSLPVTSDDLGTYTTVVDLVYRPGGTALTAAAAQRTHTVDGLEILVQQGAISYRLWTGTDPDLDVMRQAVYPQDTDEARPPPAR